MSQCNRGSAKSALLYYLDIIARTIVIGMWIGMAYYALYIFYELPSYVKSNTCPIHQCNITSSTCYNQYCPTSHYKCRLSPYTCYATEVTFSMMLLNQNYTRTLNSSYDTSGHYPTICNTNITECAYDDRDLESTLTVYGLSLVDSEDYALWIVTLCFAVSITIFIGCLLYTLKQKEYKYDPIKDDFEKNKGQV
jgi:hypothetical protein